MNNEESVRIGTIAVRVEDYAIKRRLPHPDFVGCPSLERTIESLLRREQLTDDECFEFMICSEHVDPTADEETSLKRMGEIIKVARIRRGVAADRMNDAVSF